MTTDQRSTASPGACMLSAPAPAPAPAAAAAAADATTIATLQARAALAGFTLSVMTDTDGLCLYLVSRWGMSRTLPDLAGLVAFLRQVGAVE